MNYIYRANGHLFVVLYRAEVLDVDPNEMTHWERVLHYFPTTVDLGPGIGRLMAFMPPHMQEDDFHVFEESGRLKDGIYFIMDGKLRMSIDDSIRIIETLPDVFHNLDVSTYRSEMDRYTQPFEFIESLNHRKIRSYKAADDLTENFLRMMDRFQEAVLCHYVNERTKMCSTMEIPYSLIPRRRQTVMNDPIVLH